MQSHWQHLLKYYNGPSYYIYPLLLDGPIWAFTHSLVKLHMGLYSYYNTYLLHGLILLQPLLIFSAHATDSDSSMSAYHMCMTEPLILYYQIYLGLGLSHYLNT